MQAMSLITKSCIGLALAGISFISGCRNSSSSLYPIKVNGRYGYISKPGKMVINPQFDDVGKFADGLAPVKIGNAWGYADHDGRVAINPQFEVADPFSEGLALIGSGYRFGYIDKKGKIAINPQ